MSQPQAIDVMRDALRCIAPDTPFLRTSRVEDLRRMQDWGDARDGLPPAQQAVIWYDGLPSEITRTTEFPDIHLDAIFSPAALFALLPKATIRKSRWIVLDLLGRATDEERSLARLLSPQLRWIEEPASTLLSCLQETPAQTPEESGCRDWQIRAALEVVSTTITRSGTRHAIANVLGALWLCSAVRGSPADAVTGAGEQESIPARLRKVLEALKLLPTGNEVHHFVPPGVWVDPKEWMLVDRFVLLDDLHQIGWAVFLRDALGIASNDQLRIASSPDGSGFGPQAADSLLGLLADADGVLRVKKGDSLTGARSEVLFFDLRLFQNRTPAAERQVMKKVCDLARQALAGRADLPWPGFTEEEMQAAERWVQKGEPESEDHLVALTILPRLVAQVFPRLPIVLFSTTGQRRIVEALVPYETIVRNFEKPHFVGEAMLAQLPETRERFRAALRGAMTILQGGAACDRLLSLASVGRRFPQAVTGSPHVEFYFDESGSRPDLRVGGIAVVYPDLASVSSMGRALAAAGFTWGTHRDDPLLARGLLRKSSDMSRDHQREQQRLHLQRIAEFASKNKLLVAAFHLTGMVPDATPAGFGPDHVYRQLLRDNLEILLYEWLPRLVPHGSPTVSINVATRVLGDNSASAPELLRLARRYGLGIRLIKDRPPSPSGVMQVKVESLKASGVDVKNLDTLIYTRDGEHPCALFDPDEQTSDQRNQLLAAGAAPARNFLVYSFGRDDVHPLLSELFELRSAQPRIVEAKGLQLTYDGSSETTAPSQLPRGFHFVADWAVSRPELAPSSWIDLGFQRDRKSLDRLCRASRLADRPDSRVAAIVEWEGVPPAANDKLQVWLRPKIAQLLGQLSGKEFFRLCHQLDPAKVE